MKLFYLLYGNYFLQNTGVDMKILAKIEALNKLGMPTQALVFSNSITEERRVNEYATLVPVEKNNAEAFQKIAAYLKKIDSNNCRYLMRYPFASKGLLDLMRGFPGKIYLEHNTFEKEEYLLTQKKHLKKLPVSLKPSYLKYFSETYISKSSPEKKYGDEALKFAKGGVCVTEEIARYEKKRYSGYQTYVVTNGAGVKEAEPNPISELTDTLRIFMLIGGYAPWHGVDRVVKGLTKFRKKNIKIQFDLYGLENIDPKIEARTDNYSINFYPNLGPSEMRERLAQYHLSFSSLALHRIKLKEASPLKLRTCMLMGYPMVLGYFDSDVSDNKLFSPYIMQVPANNAAINFNEVIHFYDQVRKIDSYPKKIRDLAVSTFSYEVKAGQLIDILREKLK